MYKLIDAASCQKEHILVVGSDDSAIETAIGLAKQKTNTVTISYHKTRFFRRRSHDKNMLHFNP